ncbi:TonB-dependent receptor family protein [Marinilongibacter aquaticus]|uniref:TonB-dependent receptor n=1 Tax=Marinilongibacter aquaticus TaxID=2975157 RepID=UPI0021BD67D4|nr:TonB-dependent receptor [Marinilongibacter aquaticus]UBM60546.1 TonB-dependent receptor family protein [Marinilongibacter aquaticus]
MKIQIYLFFLLITFASQAQQKITIHGIVKDTADSPLSYTSVLLLAPKDSALIAYTLSDDKGAYQFKNVAKQPLLIKATFMGYLPYQQELVMPENDNLEVETMHLNPISQELYEVVVKTAKAPLSMRGDTIEYDASKFKVPPGATLEELLRKLPGVRVDKDGNVIAQGQQVQKVTVDGRRFFGGNTKMATQNLNAESVSKVQIFDDKSEQAKLTGVDDGVKEKTLNVELKEEAKKGAFGKITAASGTDNRWTASGSFNKFDKVNQFSLIGYGNNVNQSGLSWDDREEFMGSNSFRWGDGGDFGFSGGGMVFVYFNGGDNEESFNIPFNDLSSGYSNNQAAGINYNYLKGKKDFSSSYFFSRSNQTLDNLNSRTNFLQDGSSFTSTDDNVQDNIAGHHRVNLRFQNELDSTNTITITGKGRYSNLTTDLQSHQELIRSTMEQSSMDRQNGTDKWSVALQGTAIYRKKFKKSGRVFAASVSDTWSKADLEGTQKAVVDLLNSTDPNSYFRNLDQLNTSLNGSNLIKSSMMFVEPIKKMFFWESFYNFSQTKSEIDRQVYDRQGGEGDNLNENLSRFFDNTITYNRLGTSVRYANKGSNLSLGVAAAQYNLKGQFSVQRESSLLGTVDKQYLNFTPNVSFWKSMKGNKRVGANYGMGITPPSMTNLQPYKDISNPLYVREGNPDLQPEVTHTFSVNTGMYNPVTFVNFHVNLQMTYYESQIVQNQSIDPETLVTTYKAGNVKGGQKFTPYLGFGFPIVKTKLSAYLSGGPSYTKSIALINDQETETSTFAHNYRANLDFTPVDWISLYVGGNFGLNTTKYKQNPSQNQEILNIGAFTNMNLKLPKDFYFDAKFNYTRFENERFGFDRKVPILNLFAYKLLGKAKKWELRLSAYDVFKQNKTINQFAGQNYVTQSQTRTLSRYFLLGITYNMKGVEVKKRR